MAVREPRPIIIGNWKMNGVSESLREVRLMTGMLDGVDLGCDLVVCPPATMIRLAAEALDDSRIKVGGQDCHPAPCGAFTGDISAEMLRDCGAEYVILGHSERRAYHQETDELVRQKTKAAYRAGLVAVICLGEKEEDREAGRTQEVVSAQLVGSVPDAASPDNTIIAYEPVWAIGTGRTPSLDEIADVHRAVREQLAGRFGAGSASLFRILYGGSMKPANAAAIMALENVNGGLVGQASLRAQDFLGIVASFTAC